MPRISLKYFTLISVFFIAACAVNPVSGKKEISLMSEAQEIQLGAQSDPQIVAQFGLYEDSELQSFINTKGQQMADISHRPNLKWTFRIVDSPVVNAFAVPGGYVYFTRGIMAHFNNEAEFAGVLGHEIGHVTARHSAEQYTKSTLGQILLIGGLIVSKELRAFANEAQTAMGLLFLKYSRDNESESDALGAEYSTKVGYDAREMADFFKTLKALNEEAGAEIPTFFSTHPDPADRYNKVKEHAAEWQAKIPKDKYTINRESYLKMVNGIIYGEDPRQGYVEGGIFYHPELKFQFPVPNNWRLVNSPTQVQMGPSDGKALMIFTIAQGSSLQAAAQATSEQLQLTVLNNRQITVNGLPALEVISEQVTQDPNTGQQSSIGVQSIYIDYGSNIYVFHGVAAAQNFANYETHFDRTSLGFKVLNDPSKINVVPERIKLVSVKSSGTLAQALQANGIPSARHRELAVLNGMEVNTQVASGTTIKIVGK
jgi:predicted Zn-dependent protease